MRLRIVDSKRIEMTNEEYDLYQKICNSYPQGKDLFRGLFETDDAGRIMFLIPPTKEFSMEVMIFLQNLMLQQHVRKLYGDFEAAMEGLLEFKGQAEDLQKKVDELSEKVSSSKPTGKKSKQK